MNSRILYVVLIVFSIMLLSSCNNNSNQKLQQDFVLQATAFEGRVSVFGVYTKNAVGELQKKINTLPTATAALGRTISAVSMMGINLKESEELRVKVLGNGPVGRIEVSMMPHGIVSAFIENPQTHLPLNQAGKLDVASAVGEGSIEVIQQNNLLEEVIKQSPIVSGELGEDFANYFAEVENIPSAVALGVLVDVDNSVMESGGFIIQLNSNTFTDIEIDSLEENINSLRSVTTLLHEGESIEEIIEKVVGPIEILKKMPIVLNENM